MNWIEKTIEEYWEASDTSVKVEIENFLKKKLLESYKNGAQAERRKASKEKPEAGVSEDA